MTSEHLDMLARSWQAARDNEQWMRQQLRDAVIAACDAGMTEVAAAHVAGVDRQTVRAWRGKG